jgi:hypothetical protein
MIERFNFFDIYAYLLPGAAFLGLMWLPFGIVGGKWPSADLSSALFSLVAAYIVGHVLYHPAEAALTTKGKGWYPAGPPRWRAKPSHPSEFILDAGESTFPKAFKEGLAELISSRFSRRGGVEVHDVEVREVLDAEVHEVEVYQADVREAEVHAVEVHVDFDWDKATDEQERDDESRQRDLAFLLCRSALVTANAPSYGPQFEGLYQLLRCLTVVFALAFFYHIGWALALWALFPPCVALLAILVALSIIGAAILDRWRAKAYSEKAMIRARRTIGLLMLALLLCPFFLRWCIDSASAPDLRKALLLASIAFTDLFVWVRCSSGYKPFAKKFAEHIYRDFYAYAKSQAKADTEGK